jgi:hypothetical protein
VIKFSLFTVLVFQVSFFINFPSGVLIYTTQVSLWTNSLLPILFLTFSICFHQKSILFSPSFFTFFNPISYDFFALFISLLSPSIIFFAQGLSHNFAKILAFFCHSETFFANFFLTSENPCFHLSVIGSNAQTRLFTIASQSSMSIS